MVIIYFLPTVLSKKMIANSISIMLGLAEKVTE
jgi:hypothetical protein